MPAQNTITEAEYERATVLKTPRRDDPQDIAYVEKLERRVLQEKWAKEAFATIRQIQIEYLREVLAKSDDTALVYERTQAILKEIAELLRTEIAEGAEFLEKIPKGSPVLLMSNHFSLYKLTGFNPERELGLQIPNYRYLCPTPMFIAGFAPIAKHLRNTLSIVSDDFPGVLGKIHREAGFVHVPPKEALTTGRTAYLLEQTRKLFTRRPKTALVNFPEGQTSGKHTGLGPYDLDPFKTGGYVIAGQLGVRVIPVAQCFDPQKGLRLKVFPSYIPESTERDAVQTLADRDQRQMQEWLNERKSA